MTDNTISGRAKKHDGAAIDYVSIFNWSDGKCIAQVKPSASGYWQYIYDQDLSVGITYVADGCEPITHGAYNFAFFAIGYKWWRVTNIQTRFKQYYQGITELVFFDENDADVTTDPSKAFSNRTLGAAYPISLAFDKNASTWTERQDTNVKPLADWIIGYQFDEPATIKKIGVRGRNDLPVNLGREWKSADVEVSDDGVVWTKIGVFEPMTAAEDSSLVIKPIILD